MVRSDNYFGKNKIMWFSLWISRDRFCSSELRELMLNEISCVVSCSCSLRNSNHRRYRNFYLHLLVYLSTSFLEEREQWVLFVAGRTCVLREKNIRLFLCDDEGSFEQVWSERETT